MNNIIKTNSSNHRFNTRKLRSLTSIFTEDLICTLIIYFIFGLFVMNYISFWILLISTLIYIIRVFTIRHERSHLKLTRNLLEKRLDFLSNLICVHHHLFQEPYLEKRKKHLIHHSSHQRQSNLVNNSTGVIPLNIKDPHSLIEVGSWYKTLFYCLFYEETMLYADFKNNENSISKDRKIAILISTSLIILTIYFSGFINFILFSLAYRLSAALVWHFFSYILHHHAIEKSPLFDGRLAEKSPKIMHRLTEFIFGSSHVTVVFFHAFHHKKPSEYFDFTN